MRAPVPPDALRCVATARWTGNGTKRCRKRAKGASRYCTMHTRFPPRERAAASVLLESLSAVEFGSEKEVRVEVREREGNEFVSVRLYVDGAPTRRGLYVPLDRFRPLVEALEEALERFES